MKTVSIRRRIRERPQRLKSGQAAYVLQRRMVERHDEIALTIGFIVDRKLFGYAYRMLQPDYFDSMPRTSGVFMRPLVKTKEVFPHAERPGDIDLLVIPYEDDELILDRVMGIEIKAIRAKFKQQGKSPNDFGFSQTSSLLDLGLPYVSLAYLIVSDQTPRQFWRDVHQAEVLNPIDQSIGSFKLTTADLLPADLIKRNFGRLQKNCQRPEIGLLSAYISNLEINPIYAYGSTWLPYGRVSKLNTRMSYDALDAVECYFNENALSFFDTPRFDPS